LIEQELIVFILKQLYSSSLFLALKLTFWLCLFANSWDLFEITNLQSDQHLIAWEV